MREVLIFSILTAFSWSVACLEIGDKNNISIRDENIEESMTLARRGTKGEKKAERKQGSPPRRANSAGADTIGTKPVLTTGGSAGSFTSAKGRDPGLGTHSSIWDSHDAIFTSAKGRPPGMDPGSPSGSYGRGGFGNPLDTSHSAIFNSAQGPMRAPSDITRTTGSFTSARDGPRDARSRSPPPRPNSPVRGAQVGTQPLASSQRRPQSPKAPASSQAQGSQQVTPPGLPPISTGRTAPQAPPSDARLGAQSRPASPNSATPQSRSTSQKTSSQSELSFAPNRGRSPVRSDPSARDPSPGRSFSPNRQGRSGATSRASSPFSKEAGSQGSPKSGGLSRQGSLPPAGSLQPSGGLPRSGSSPTLGSAASAGNKSGDRLVPLSRALSGMSDASGRSGSPASSDASNSIRGFKFSHPNLRGSVLVSPDRAVSSRSSSANSVPEITGFDEKNMWHSPIGTAPTDRRSPERAEKLNAQYTPPSMSRGRSPELFNPRPSQLQLSDSRFKDLPTSSNPQAKTQSASGSGSPPGGGSGSSSGSGSGPGSVQRVFVRPPPGGPRWDTAKQRAEASASPGSQTNRPSVARELFPSPQSAGTASNTPGSQGTGGNVPATHSAGSTTPKEKSDKPRPPGLYAKPIGGGKYAGLDSSDSSRSSSPTTPKRTGSPQGNPASLPVSTNARSGEASPGRNGRTNNPSKYQATLRTIPSESQLSTASSLSATGPRTPAGVPLTQISPYKEELSSSSPGSSPSDPSSQIKPSGNSSPASPNGSAPPRHAEITIKSPHGSVATVPIPPGQIAQVRVPNPKDGQPHGKAQIALADYDRGNKPMGPFIKRPNVLPGVASNCALTAAGCLSIASGIASGGAGSGLQIASGATLAGAGILGIGNSLANNKKVKGCFGAACNAVKNLGSAREEVQLDPDFEHARRPAPLVSTNVRR